MAIPVPGSWSDSDSEPAAVEQASSSQAPDFSHLRTSEDPLWAI